MGVIDASGATVDTIENDLSGVAQLGEVSIGGTPAPGLVIGGGLYGTNVFVTKAENAFYVEDDAGTSALSLVGPFVDYYFDPTGGLHVLAAPCLALATFPDLEEVQSGLGISLGAGWEAFVGAEWSIGVLGRFQYASVSNPSSGSSDSVLVPGLLFVVTHH